MRPSFGIILIAGIFLSFVSPSKAYSQGKADLFYSNGKSNVIVLMEQGRIKEAENFAVQTLAKSLKTNGKYHEFTGTCYGSLGTVYLVQKKMPQAKNCFALAIEVNDRCFGPENKHSAVWHSNLAELYLSERKFDQAENHAKKSIAGHEEDDNPNPYHVALALHKLATIYQWQGRFDDAVPAFQRALRIFDGDHRGTQYAEMIRSQLKKIDRTNDEDEGTTQETSGDVPTVAELIASADRAVRSAVESGRDKANEASMPSPAGAGELGGVASEMEPDQMPIQSDQITRREFKQKVRPGMTKEQVKQQVGKPDRTMEDYARTSWFYSDIFDEDAENLGRAHVVFVGVVRPVVDSVSFN